MEISENEHDPDFEYEMLKDREFEWLCDEVEALRIRAERQGYSKEGFFNALLNIAQVEVY